MVLGVEVAAENFYAPPKASLQLEVAHECWRDGKVPVVSAGTAL
jgi:hypothetical protein